MDKDLQKKLAAERIKRFRKSLEMNQTEFADFLEMDENGQATVSKWETRKQLPGSEYTARLAQKSGKSPVYFSGLEPASNDITVRGQQVILAGEIEAGNWREGEEWAVGEADDPEYVTLPSYMDIPRYNMKAFIVRGNSMDKVYPDGSIVFVAGLFDNPIQACDGNIVMVQRRNLSGQYEATLKQMVVDGAGQKWLWPRSNDPKHQSPVNLSNGIHEGEDVVIVGVVQAAIGKPPKAI